MSDTPLDRLGDRILARIAPRSTAKADQFECTWQYRCQSAWSACIFAGAKQYQRRQVCAGYNGPSYGPWRGISCGC